MKKDAVAIGENVRTLRAERGMSAAALSRALKVNPSTVCYIESGKRTPSDELLGRLRSPEIVLAPQRLI